MVMKTDANGAILWAHNYGDSVGATSHFDVFRDFEAIQGGYAFIGSTNQSGTNDYMLAITGEDGFTGCYHSVPQLTVEDVTTDIRDSTITVIDSVFTKTFGNWTGFTTTDLTITASDMCVVGIDASAPPQIGIHPNPADHHVTVTCAIRPERLQLLGIRGEVIVDTKPWAASTTLPLAGVPSGMYLVRVKNVSGWATSRLVVR
jgi:hypothetical protein